MVTITRCTTRCAAGRTAARTTDRRHAAQPDAAQPDAAQPDAAQPDAAQPDAAKALQRLREQCDHAGRRLYDAEVALHIAHQTHVDAWISAASNRLHDAVVNLDGVEAQLEAAIAAAARDRGSAQ